MIKKLKIGLLVAVLTLAVGVGSASAADLIFSVDTNVTIGSATYTIASGSQATTIAPGASSIEVVIPADVFFTFKSADKYTLNSSYGAMQCGASFSSITIERAGTYTITPDTNAVCTSGSGGTPSGGSAPSGSVAPAATPTAPVVSVAPPALVVPDLGCTGGAFSTTTGKACAAATVTPATPATPAVPGVTSATPATPAKVYNFGTATLKNGSKGEAVKELQRFLNAKLNLGLVVDGALGPKTIAVIKQWQSDNGLVADGLIGAKTKAMMNSQADTATTPATAPSASSGSTTYNFGTTTLKNGSRGEAVKELQRFLNAKLNLGLSIDGALGPKTIAVIKQWQSDNGLVADGLIGTKTKAMMNAQAGQ